MTNNANYWAIHKEIYTRELDALLDDKREEILDNPLGEAAQSFNNKIKKLVEEQL